MTRELWELAVEEFMRHDTRKKVAFGEDTIVEWFMENYKSLGFEKILKKQWNKTPDFIMLRDGGEVKVEIEHKTSSFIQHGHRVSEADVVVCCIEDVKLDERIKVIPLNQIFISYDEEIYPMIDPSRREFSPDELRDVVDMWNKKPKNRKP